MILSHPKHIVKFGELPPDEEDKALLESNLSASSGPFGGSSSARVNGPCNAAKCNTPTGSNAKNSPTTIKSPKTANTDRLDAADSSSPASVGLFKEYVNSDTREIIGIVDAYREHCSKLEHTPHAFLHLKHKEDGSTALYRVNAASSSRYFQQGRVQMIKNISQRLDGSQVQGVFFTLTVDAKRYTLTEAWPSMWPEFNRFKDAMNVYRKRHMNAGQGVLYLAALEPHKSHYPHLHVYCPGLRWLIRKQDLGKLDNWWGMGSVNTKKERRQDSARGYILKYVSKLEGWSEVSLALLWRYKIRIYNLSHKYYSGESDSEWELLGRYKDAESLSEGLGIGYRQAEALMESWADLADNLVYLS
jgi:hypothetical protein